MSVVTVCLNAEQTIAATLDNVRGQSYKNIEHIVIDGGSSDRTSQLIEESGVDIFVSEPDNGIYHAMDKGARLATGEFVFFLNSGDLFYDERVVEDAIEFFRVSRADAIFGNLVPYRIAPNTTYNHRAFVEGKIIDYSYFRNRRFFFLESIHHQTVFYRKKIFDFCSYQCPSSAATGEYYLHMSAFVATGYTLRHFPRLVCKFALGGVSTANFESEWDKFLRARNELRAMFFARGPKITRQSYREYYCGRLRGFNTLRAWKRHLQLSAIALRYSLQIADR